MLVYPRHVLCIERGRNAQAQLSLGNLDAVLFASGAVAAGRAAARRVDLVAKRRS
jgi:hypothetical protein